MKRSFAVLAALALLSAACQYDLNDPGIAAAPSLSQCAGVQATHGYGFNQGGGYNDPAGGSTHTASTGDDVIVVVNGPVTVNGGGGNDVFCVQNDQPAQGTVTIQGGGGNDTVYAFYQDSIALSSVESEISFVVDTANNPNQAGEYIGWAVVNGERVWMGDSCRSQVEAATGYSFVVRDWNTQIFPIPLANPQLDCNGILALLPTSTPPVSGECPGVSALTPFAAAYDQHLANILARPGATTAFNSNTDVRNALLDQSIHECTASANLPLTTAGSNPLIETNTHNVLDGTAGPTEGNFRARCDFSHLAYDDPIVHPNQPGVAHLHTFFGNTHANAYSNYDTLLDSGSSTCKGLELNRTAYWVPALFDSNDNVRVPDYMLVYYKNGRAQAGGAGPQEDAATYPAGLNVVSNMEPGGTQETRWYCGPRAGDGGGNATATIPTCGTGQALNAMIRFPFCWNEQDLVDGPGGDNNDHLIFPTLADGSTIKPEKECPSGQRLPELKYYVVWENISNTSNLHLSSDFDEATGNPKPPGSTLHGDWYGAWHPVINQRWVANCNNQGALTSGQYPVTGNPGVNCEEKYLGDNTSLELRYGPGGDDLAFQTMQNKIIAPAALAQLCDGTIGNGGATCS